MKTCGRCKEVKDIAEFHRDSNRKDGRQSYCRECQRKYDRKRNQTAERREYLSKRNQTAEMRQYKRKNMRRYRQMPEYRARILARDAARYAIVTGKLTKEACAVCGSTDKIEAHHQDYSRPLDVIWLCPKHHRELHNREKRYGSLQLTPREASRTVPGSEERPCLGDNLG